MSKLKKVLIAAAVTVGFAASANAMVASEANLANDVLAEVGSHQEVSMKSIAFCTKYTKQCGIILKDPKEKDEQ